MFGSVGTRKPAQVQEPQQNAGSRETLALSQEAFASSWSAVMIAAVRLFVQKLLDDHECRQRESDDESSDNELLKSRPRCPAFSMRHRTDHQEFCPVCASGEADTDQDRSERSRIRREIGDGSTIWRPPLTIAPHPCFPIEPGAEGAYRYRSWVTPHVCVCRWFHSRS